MKMMMIIKKHLLVLTLWLLAATSAHAEGLFYKLTKPGTKPNYILGTLHSDDLALVAMNKDAVGILTKSDTALFEIANKPENITKAFGYMYFTPNSGQTLRKSAGADLYADYAKLIKLIDPAQDPKNYELLKPWAAAILLQYPESVADGIFLDMRLEQYASAKKIPVIGIENVDEQMSIFNNISNKEQVTMLRDAVQSYDENMKMQQQMFDYYKAKDIANLQKLMQLSISQSSDPALAKKLMKMLLDDRNKTMAERVAPYFAKGGAFMAVGALHLPGTGGVLDRLAKHGYKVEIVY